MDNQEKVKACRICIHGRVQGVGFRYWAQKQARRCGVVGWVRNEPDGTVLVECEGGNDGMNSFLTALRQGPPGAFVQKADLQDRTSKGTFQDFTIEF